MTPRFPDSGSQASRVALFPGSFDPFTTGHQSIVDRALPLFDHIVIAIGVNIAKANDDSILRRVKAISKIYHGDSRITVTTYSGLTVDACRENGAGFILRGVRNVADFEYERNMADANRRISGIETVLLPTLPELSCVSSSMVRELDRFGHDTSTFLP